MWAKAWCTNNCFLYSEFAKEKDRVESRAGFLLLKEEQKLEKEMNGYMNWICKAGKEVVNCLSLPLRLKTASLTSFGRRKTMVAANPLLHNSSSSSLSNNIGTMMSHSLALLISLMPS